MGTNIEERFSELESGRASILADLALWREDSLNRRPAANAWSALDVVEHIIKLEQATIVGVPGNLPDGHTVSLGEKIKSIAITWAMKMPMRVKIPPKLDYLLPEGNRSLTGITENWNEERSQFHGLIRDHGPWTERGVFLHPISGWISMPNMLALLCSHQKHHTYQLRRLSRALASSR